MKRRSGGATGFAEVSKARLGKAQSQEMLDYVWTPYADIDDENIAVMARCNMAHTVMLKEQKLLTRAEAAAILRSMERLLADRAKLRFDPVKGDLFFNVEAFVIEHAGPDAGGKMHIGRSRIDLIAALMRLKVRRNLLRLLPVLMRLREAVLEKAARSTDAVMPSYTHLQPAQVSTFGHYMVAFYDVLTRDLKRVFASFDTTNESPLGSAASSGTSWDLDRLRVSELLGFSKVIENTKDAAHNYDWLPEVMAACGILMNNIGRVATELYIWCSHEFSLIDLDGAFAASSSIMPQKKNPYSLEMIKARTGEITASFGAVLEVLKGETGGTAFDIKLSGPRIADNAVNRVADMSALITPLITTLMLKRDRMFESAGDGFTTAVSLVDAMVVHGLSFRSAHHVVGRLVRMCSDAKLTYRDVTPDLLNKAAREILGHDLTMTEGDIRNALDPAAFVRDRNGLGGPAEKEVKRMIAARRRENVKWQAMVDMRAKRVGDSEVALAKASQRISRSIAPARRRVAH